MLYPEVLCLVSGGGGERKGMGKIRRGEEKRKGGERGEYGGVEWEGDRVIGTMQ